MSDIPRGERAPNPAEDVDGEIEEIEDAADDGGEGEAGDGADEGDATDGETDGDDEGEDEEVEAEPAPRRGGGSQTVREQRRRRQEAERELAEERRQRQEDRQRLALLEQRVTQPDPQAAARAEQEWYQSLELLSPADMARQVMARGRQEVGRALQNIQFQANDRADKQAYDAQARINPIFKRFQPEVERVLAAERAAGRNPDREVILDVLYGREMRARAERAAPGQRRAGAARGAAQRTGPTGAKSTLKPGGRRPAPGSIEADEALVAAAIARGERVF